MLDTLASATAATLLNSALAREARARAGLSPYGGRIVRFESPPLVVTLAITADGLFAPATDESSAVTITLPLGALPFALLDPQQPLKEMRLAGDAELAQTLSEVLQQLRPEPEEELSRWVGDIAAERIVGALRTTALHGRQLAQNLADNAAHYLVAENPMVVERAELAVFAADVNRLRDDVERFDKRLQRLQS